MHQRIKFNVLLKVHGFMEFHGKNLFLNFKYNFFKKKLSFANFRKAKNYYQHVLAVLEKIPKKIQQHIR